MIYFVNWLNKEADQRFAQLTSRFGQQQLVEVRLENSMAETIKQCAYRCQSDYFWMLDSQVDYSNFEFPESPEIGLEPYMQVFGANTWYAPRELVFRAQSPYIEDFPDKHFVKTDLTFDRPLLDIVYISNGEPEAEKHYQHLLETVKTGNKIHRIDRVNGRTAAYQAAARVSTTAWFFAVFAKIEVDPGFDWTWQPSKPEPQHTIFYAKNPVNGLEYGHMAVVAYNKHQTLKTNEPGLDFVMSAPHTVEPILSGTAHYNQDEIVTWRTAFRESIKLMKDGSPLARERLQAWTHKGTGAYSVWSMRGAREGVKYYTEVDGQHQQLMLSYDWAWLNDRFRQLYKR